MTYAIHILLPARGGTTTTEVLPYDKLDEAMHDAANGSLRIPHTEWIVKDREKILAVFWNGGRVQ